MSEELTHSEMQKIGEEVVAVLCTIFDPEIPVDIYQLGLIYDVKVSTERDVHILMTLTSPNCPVAESMPQEVKDKAKALDSVRDAEVEITFENRFHFRSIFATLWHLPGLLELTQNMSK